MNGSVIRIIPCLDVSNGRVVKGTQFQNLRDIGSPRELARRYEEQGADELVFLDISATVEGRDAQICWIKDVRAELSIPLTVGGGVNSVETAQVLLKAGADKIAVNTAAVANPSLISELSRQFGRQCVVLAIDAKGGEVVTHAGKRSTGITACKWAIDGEELGAGEILLTSYDRDGTGAGYDCELLRQIAESVKIPFIASGGARTSTDMIEAIKSGASALLAASIFHDQVVTILEIKQDLQRLGVLVRIEQ